MSDENGMPEDAEDDDPGYSLGKAIDTKALEKAAKFGAKCVSEIYDPRIVGKGWQRWSGTILGLRALRDMAFIETRTSDLNSWHYKQAMGRLLSRKTYAAYEQIDRPSRSWCYKLMDHIDEINVEYAKLSPQEQARWNHPESVAKNVAASAGLVAKQGHNRPPPAKLSKKKVASTVESERLTRLLIEAIRCLTEPDAEVRAAKARELMGKVMPDEVEFDDSVEDI
jgi:hypothetical protein